MPLPIRANCKRIRVLYKGNVLVLLPPLEGRGSEGLRALRRALVPPAMTEFLIVVLWMKSTAHMCRLGVDRQDH
jgi:hypothetical protein